MVILQVGKFPFQSSGDLFGRNRSDKHVFGLQSDITKMTDVAVVGFDQFCQLWDDRQYAIAWNEEKPNAGCEIQVKALADVMKRQ